MININISNKKFGFSMAEAILAISIMGILAAIAMPTLVSSSRKIVLENTEKKQVTTLSQAMTMLSLRSIRPQFTNTEGFVNELKEYLRISKICKSDDIKSCWPTEKVELEDGSSYSISGAQTNSVFLMNNIDPYGNTADYANDNIAFITENGTSILINYNRNCNPNSGDMNKSCYVGIVDLNGDKSPNKIGEDVKILNARGFVVPSGNTHETAGTSGAKQNYMFFF